ncbi:MAG: hypothetical protein J2P54_08180 [Bradyrhizobiaceae bacterium]|nr:hypothetical protein [Bradyrhizobiaceae bacterium]
MDQQFTFYLVPRDAVEQLRGPTAIVMAASPWLISKHTVGKKKPRPISAYALNNTTE